MKLRNVKVAKRLGTKTLAGLLAFGLVVGTPSVVLADVQSTMSQSDAVQTEKLQAKSVDGRDTLTDVSDKVMDMIQKGEVKLDEESKYLIDTVTGKKVDPVTGERVGYTGHSEHTGYTGHSEHTGYAGHSRYAGYAKYTEYAEYTE